MVTKTRPRTVARTHFSGVKLRKADRLLIAESLGIHPTRKKADLDAAINDLQLLLAHAKFRLNLVKTRSLPANIVAELRPIADSATALGDALDLTRMSPAAWTELTFDINALARMQEQVAVLHELASHAIERLSGKSSQGKDVQVFSDSLASVNLAIERVFNKHLVDDLDDRARALALIEFQTVCRKYLPKPPNPRKTTKKPGKR